MKEPMCSWCLKCVDRKKAIRVPGKSLFVKSVCAGDGSFDRFYHAKCLQEFRKYVLSPIPSLGVLSSIIHEHS